MTNISDDGQLIADEDGELITVDVQKPNKTTAMVSLALSAFDEDDVPRLLSEGWIPVVDTISNSRLPAEGLDEMSARQIASLLAMKSVGIVFPKTRAVRPEVILETRARLSEHLPPFWSAMLKLSVEMKSRIKECASMQDVLFEAQFLVDTLVLPTLIDLQQKMLKDKKDWFYRILAPVQKGIRLMIGNPPLTQQQLLTNALILGSDVIMSAAENMRTIEALKQEAGLTFLLEAEKILSKQDA